MEQFDGMKVYEYGSGRPAVFEIRGGLIHEYGVGRQAVYEIRGNLIYEYGRGTQAVYEIRGRLIHEYGRGTQALFEIRCQFDPHRPPAESRARWHVGGDVPRHRRAHAACGTASRRAYAPG